MTGIEPVTYRLLLFLTADCATYCATSPYLDKYGKNMGKIRNNTSTGNRTQATSLEGMHPIH